MKTAAWDRIILAVGVLSFLSLPGCKASGVTKTVRASPGLQISVIGVYPFGFRWEEPAYRSFELSQRLIDVGLKQKPDEVLFFGPSEFKIFQPNDDNAWAATDMVAQLPPTGVRPEAAVMLRPWAERRMLEVQKDLSSERGKHLGSASVQEVTYVGHLEVLHPSSHETVLELTAETTVDPFAERPEDDSDPAPELTALMEKLSAEAFKTLGEYLHPPTAPAPLPLGVAFNPKAALSYGEDGRPSLEIRLASMDAVEVELVSQGRIRFANPGLTDAEVTQLTRLPGGLLVKTSVAGAKLAAGDVITMIDEHPALPQALGRLRFAPVPAQVKVRRASGEWTEIVLP